MTAFGEWDMTLRVDADCRLTIHLPPPRDDACFGAVTLEIPGTLLTGRFELYGHDLRAFVAGLTRMHRELAGETYLPDDWGDNEIWFRVTDPRRGAVRIDGAFQLHGRPRGGGGGVRVTFGPFEIDQTFLPLIADGVERYLSESGIRV